MAIKFLLENFEDQDRAQKCFEFCLKEAESFEVGTTQSGLGNGSAKQDIKSWLELAKEMNDKFETTGNEPLVKMLPEALEAQGWLKVCTALSFYWLLRSKKIQGDTFDYVMRETIRCGGDTDTNACIVGGMIGAVIGYKKINGTHIGKVF